MDSDGTTIHVRIYLNGGQIIDGHLEWPDDSAEPDDVAYELLNRLARQTRPGWLRLDHILVHTHAVTGIEVLG